MTDLDTRGDVREPQESAKRWRIIGPGLVVAATGIGAGDLVATLVAGSRFGYALLWAAILGVIIKIFLVEGAGRYSLATGRTIFEGWRSVGRWTTWYFGPYILIWGLVYGAAAMSSSALPLAALFPGVDLKVFAIGCGLVGAVVVWFGRYSAFERIIAVFVGLMFVTVVGAAVVTLPNVPALLTGLVPTIPEGGLVVALSIAGGVGGTITLAAYGYWLREKGWVAPGWMKVMRIDNSVAYVMSGVFVLSMLVVGAELLYSADIALADGEGGLVQLADVLGERYGAFMTWFFLLGFFATSFSSILGVWNGVSLMFADFLGTIRGLDVDDPRRRLGGSYYRAFILWLTIPPIGLLFLDQPIGLIIAYGVLGALFMPFLAITLLVLLNTDRTPRAWRNRPLSNTVMGISALLFVVLGVQQLVTEVGKLL
ncbi:Nramp family divalent metal transporter [Clavibacter capsici]|uniref:Divalent metal cation transporter n=1 Tax=Clavibacter capsici TaxID=1874630 RepID=A0A0M4HAI5_9MICO|nr:Nramp family divalent metal transporter [Clavibacter capsici]ALD13230.1 iron transporter [Clavibacter capsici]OUE31430.1 Divalent metal cation transporter MntH [Clavibacter michiganensis]QIS42462.1 divalent metal cation transporter [Clavibacter capsici]QIS45412.1 divalent metal cation transporter [Clavibacter capsici]